MSKASRDLGTYGAESGRSLWPTAEECGGNIYRGSGDILSKGLEGLEYVGKGVGNMIGGSCDGLYKGYNYARGAPKSPSPSPGSMQNNNQQFQGVIETGKPAF